MDLADEDFADAKDILVHVDLMTPFADLTVSSEKELASAIQPGAFEAFPGTSVFRDCARLVVLTLRVPCATSFRRWQQRGAEQGRSNIRPVMAHIYSETSGEDSYAALYDAWDQYIDKLPKAAKWNIFESPDGSRYSVVRANEAQ
jgi:hypothetical protein